MSEGAFPVPPADYVPAGGPARAVATAHAAQEVLSDIAHARRHAGAVAASGSPELVRFNESHCHDHIAGAITQQNSSISNLVQLDPRAGAELMKLRDTAGRSLPSLCPVPGCVLCEVSRSGKSWQYAPPGPAREKTPGHLAQTVLVALMHARQHVLACQDAPDAENLSFDLSHLISHLDESHNHQRKYIGAVAEIFPAVAAELGALGKLADVGPVLSGGPPADRAFAGLPDYRRRDRCDSCGEQTGGSACIECGLDGSGNAYQRAHDQLAAQYATGSRWEGPL